MFIRRAVSRCISVVTKYILIVMNVFKALINVISLLSIAASMSGKIKTQCGLDKSPVNVVYEGFANIHTYPWLGILYYPLNNKRFTTAVVLVTRQIVLGAASEIDLMPKYNFRKRAKVVLGQNCTGLGIGIRDYSYHPEYLQRSFSTLAIIQLEVDTVKFDLRPICSPPAHFTDPKFYAMILSDDCEKFTTKIYKMHYVPQDECKAFYRRSGLDVDSMWPSHTACARSTKRGKCVWRSGAILVVKHGRRWRLLGFGVYGPGCEAPARFLDYGMYHKWVLTSITRIGRPAVSTIDSNHLILRRTSSKVQRFGRCDSEEMKTEIYTDQISIVKQGSLHPGTVRYNISLYTDVEYSCVLFRADYNNVKSAEKPRVSLRRWCAGPVKYCFGFQFLEIHFFVEIVFTHDVTYTVKAYGKEAKIIDPKKVMEYLAKNLKQPKIVSYNETVEKFKSADFRGVIQNKWFYRT